VDIKVAQKIDAASSCRTTLDIDIRAIDPQKREASLKISSRWRLRNSSTLDAFGGGRLVPVNIWY
jgi:hypothetical protein